MASIPPEANRFDANVVRTLCSANGPNGSSSADGRAPEDARKASERSRSSSKSAAYR
ncbi:Uncharacterised protein [Mycobacteroides abscessus subsp. abscessus]|nr:Uncharacterised protein [Mycobacteroides abscessus subsp. abscessus]